MTAFGQAPGNGTSTTQHPTSVASVPSGSAIVQGHVRDASGKAVTEGTVTLQSTQQAPSTTSTLTSHTDSEGAFRFTGIREDIYTLHAETKSGDLIAVRSVTVSRGETKTVDLVDDSPGSSGNANQPEFFDEPQFTVAGVAPASNSGGHGSDTVLRNSEALVKATSSLGKDSAKAGDIEHTLADIQAQLQHEGAPQDEPGRIHQSDLHHHLGELEENLGQPLEAVHEYQRAAELAPSETNLFDWGTELLTHRALEPATEVFSKGSQRYPESARMLIGLGVAWYARGSAERAAQYLANASDLNPSDATPYLFMGKMQSAENVPSKDTVDRLARFQHIAPRNALANYYYAVGLWKLNPSADVSGEATATQVEALLEKAIQLDPNLGPAHLQLGILYAQRGDYARSITSYEKAIEVSPELEEAHYRLAQAYRRMGATAKAQEQLRLHEQLSKQAKEQAERERREIQQFVISLRDKTADAPAQAKP